MSKTQSEKRSRFVSLRMKLLFGFTLIFTVVFLGLFFWFTRYAQDIALQRIQEDMTDTLSAAAAGIDGDELLTLYREGTPNATGSSDNPLYQKHLEWLDFVNTIEPRAWPFTYIAGDKENEVVFLTDLYAKYDPAKAVTFKEVVESSGSLTGGLEQVTLKLTPYTDDWGSWVSAYMPVKDQEGKEVGGIGVDFLASYLTEVRQRIRNSLLATFTILYAVLFILVYLASGAFSRPVVKLTNAALEISEGNYEIDIAALTAPDRFGFSDETDQLAEVFELMISKVRTREETLRQQVKELKIGIDEAKRQEQVSEIVESDFFQELQAKAQAARRRSKGGQAKSEDDKSAPS